MPRRTRPFTLVLAILIVLAGACSSDDGDDRSAGTAAPQTTTSSAGPTATTTEGETDGADVEAGTFDGSVDVARTTRTYQVHVPAGLSEGDSVPLLIALHGGGGSAEQHARTSGWADVADAEGFVVAFPDGSGRIPTWNAGICCGQAVTEDADDVAFVAALIDELTATLPIDGDQVVVAGHSNGATMSYRLACELADRIVAIGVQSAPLTFGDCTPSEPVSVLHIHGAQDANVPLDGGKGTRGISGVDWPSVRRGLDVMAAAAGCELEPSTSESDGVTTTDWTGCADGTVVELIVVADGEHGWMKAGDSGRGATGPGGFDSTATIWEFLDRQLD